MIGDVVAVYWEDASNMAEWMSWSEAQAFEDHCSVSFTCCNVGVLVRDDETSVVVAARFTEDHEAVGLVERIPRGIVRRIVVLEATHGGS